MPSKRGFLPLLLHWRRWGGCLLAAINLHSEGKYVVPTDGAWWVEGRGGLEAKRVPINSPAHRAGVRQGDVLVEVNEHPTPTLAPFVRELDRSGVWGHATYSILRPGAHSGNLPGSTAKFDIQVILEPPDRSINQGMRLIALAYLCMGIYVLFRRWTAPKSTHFYVFCLVSFILYSFRYTGEFDTFDWVIYWANIAASGIQPALFLHFAVSFSGSFIPDQRRRVRDRLLIMLLYVPGVLLITLQCMAINLWSATEVLRHRLDQIAVCYLAIYYLIAAVVFTRRYRKAESALERQQLKWLTRGTWLAIAPFTLFWVIPYLLDLTIPSLLTKLAGLSLVFLPLTFSWAIVRYRLMDVDLIFKRGVTYTLATAAIVGVYFGSVALTAELVHTRAPYLGVWGW